MSEKSEPVATPEQEYETGVNYLKACETIFKKLPVDFDTHLARIDMLRFLVERLKNLRERELRDLEAPTTQAKVEDLK